jgi:hypothetical protein
MQAEPPPVKVGSVRGHHGAITKAAIILGSALIVAALTVGFWPQRATVNGRSYACPNAIFAATPMNGDPIGDKTERATFFACGNQTLAAVRVTYGLGFVGVALAVGAWVLHQRRAVPGRYPQSTWPPPN